MASFSIRPRSRFFLGGLVGIALLATTLAWTSRRFRLDDALITHRYAMNVAEGRGWIYNAGEHHNGSTSPLFTLLVAVGGRAIGDYPLAAHILSALALVASSLIAAEMVRTAHARWTRQAPAGSRSNGAAPWTSEAAGVLTGLAIASNPLQILTFGLETQLFIALSAAAAYSAQRGAAPLAGAPRESPLLRGPEVRTAVLGSLATLTRGEGAILLALAYLWDVRRARRLLWGPIIASVSIAAPWIVYAGVNIGSPFPDTLSAKIAQSEALATTRFLLIDAAGLVLRYFGFGTLYNMLPFYLAPLGLFFAPLGPLLLTAAAAAQVAFYSYINVGGYHWYFAPALYAAAVMSGVGLAGIASRAPRIIAWLPIVAALAGVGFQARASARIPTPQLGEDENYHELGLWLRDNGGPDVSVAALEVGTIGWYSGATIVDPLGLVTPASPQLRRKDFTWWIDERRPTYIVVHRPAWAPIETQTLEHPSFKRDYREVRTIGPPGPRQCIVYQRIQP